MFDLEKAIAKWRKQMLAAGIQTPTLDELENHLREEIERQTKSGVGGQPAFEAATEKIGQPGKLKTEFKKVPIPLEMQLVKLAGIASGVVGTLFLLWTAYVALFIHEANWASRIFSLLAVAATVFIWSHAGKFLPAIRHPKARAAVGLASCVAGFGGMLVFIRQVLPGLFDFSAGAEFSLNRLLICFIIAWMAMAILGVFAYRLDEAADKKEAQHV
jgi:hypothetical protein